MEAEGAEQDFVAACLEKNENLVAKYKIPFYEATNEFGTSEGKTNEFNSQTETVTNDAEPDLIGQRSIISEQRVYSCVGLHSFHSNIGLQNQLRQNLLFSRSGEGIHILLKKPRAQEEDDEIEISPMPPSPLQHRVVQVNYTNYNYFYHIQKQIGRGRFGHVFKCIDVKSGVWMAAKYLKCSRAREGIFLRTRSLKRPNVSRTSLQQEPVTKEDVENEITILNHIDHVNIIKLYDAFEFENEMVLILEYIAGGEMFERLLADEMALTEFDAILYMKQICSAVQYLHKNMILHLDLKPENIMCVDKTSHHIKIIDFGLAIKYNPRQKMVAQWGTPEFMAPEILNYEVVSPASDMWSVGVITYILISGISPFLGHDDNGTIRNVIESHCEFDSLSSVTEEARDFISRLLVEEKSGRMSGSQCLRHSWLSTPLTDERMIILRNKKKLRFLARKHWKAGLAAITAANRFLNKNHVVKENKDEFLSILKSADSKNLFEH